MGQLAPHEVEDLAHQILSADLADCPTAVVGLQQGLLR
jgi:hypothetical protein